MRYFTTALLLFVSLIIFPKERYYFSNLSLKDGLSQITVTTIHQDKKGYMWFGTRNGLNRYDGYQFEAFVNNSENTSSISDNHILCIAEDNKNCLWIGTNNGLNKLDLTTDKIKRYLLPNNMVSSLYFDTDENLWIGTNSKLYLYKPSKDSFTQININGLQTNNTINAIVRKNEELYVGTSAQGVIVYNIKNNEYYIIKHEPANLGSIAHNNIRAILIDKNDNLWIGTHYGGVSLRKKGHNNFTTYNKGNGLTNDYVRAITEAPDGNIVVGTFNGLNTINPQTNEIVQYKT